MTGLLRRLDDLSMDSNQRRSPQTPIPFGYYFGNVQRPQDPPGQPLLPNNNNFSLDGFWDNPNSVGQFLNYDFLNTSTPPEFLGQLNPQNTSSSNTLSNFPFTFDTGNIGLLDFGNDNDQAIPSDDVLGAASALFNNVHNGQSHGLDLGVALSGQQAQLHNYNGQYPMEPSSGLLSNLPPIVPHAGAFDVRSGATWHEPGISLPQSNPPANAMNDPLSPYQSYDPLLARPLLPQGLNFGSDNAFAQAGFLRPPYDSEEAATAAMLSTLEAFERQSSDTSTQSASPVLQRHRTHPSVDETQPSRPVVQRHRKHPSVNETIVEESDEDEQGPQQSMSRKRRKMKDQVEDEGCAVTTSKARPQPPHRNTSSANARPSQARIQSSASVKKSTLATDDGPGVTTPSPGPTANSTASTNRPRARRQSKAVAQGATSASRGKSHRSPRENLSEQQKKDNHIRSEKKRRDLITQGFKDLETLVPALKGGGISKSNMLTEAADFLENLVEGNKRLKDLLGETGGLARADAEEERGNGERGDG